MGNRDDVKIQVVAIATICCNFANAGSIVLIQISTFHKINTRT